MWIYSQSSNVINLKNFYFMPFLQSDHFASCTLKNSPRAEGFLLLGFIMQRDVNVALFAFFLVIYMTSLFGNIIIITLSRIDTSLRTPMYFFLSNFSFLEICYTSVTVPKMLFDLLSGNMAISFYCCLTQMYFFFLFGTTEFYILAIMALDRYVAICHPLHYSVVMNRQFCYKLVLGSWLSGCIVPVLPTILLTQKPFCGSKIINHFFCDVGPLILLSSPDKFYLDAIVFTVSGIVVICSLTLVTVSYVFIISAILRISSSAGRHRAFSTCASHFSVVTLFFGTVIFMYLFPHSKNYELDKAVSVFYSIVTPALNPIIYSLRNKEVKKALVKVLQKREHWRKLGDINSITLNTYNKTNRG